MAEHALAAGIDPGLKGAIAIVWTTGRVNVYDMPTMKAGDAGRDSLDLVQLAELLREVTTSWRAPVVVEEQIPMPKQGVRSTFTTGQGYGVLLGMLTVFGERWCTVRPQEWKRALQLGKGKDANRALASRLYPEERASWALKSHDGRADATLLAHYAATRLWPQGIGPRTSRTTAFFAGRE